MKRLFIMLLVTNAVFACMSSCKKDPVVISSTGGRLSPSQYSIELTADHWVKNSNGFYVRTFNGIISTANNGNPKVMVYLKTNGEEKLINQFIFFMGGELWATSTQTDVKVNFRCSSDKLPFNYLIIKVVVE